MIYLFLTAVLLHAHLSGTEAFLNAEFTTPPCPGNQISFNCTVSALDTLWTVPPPITQISIASTQTTVADPPYTVEVLSVDEPGNMLTTRLTTAAVNGVTIGCGSITTGSIGIEIQTVDPPTSPSGVIHSISSTLGDEAVVSVQWIPNSEADNYLVTISPTAPLQPSGVVTDAAVSVTVTGGTEYTISIVATNCARNSTPIDYQFRVASCSQLSFNPGVVFDISSTVESATVSYGCSNAPNSDLSTCGADGLWTPDTTLLVCPTPPPPVTCGAPQSPVNGTVSNTSPSSQLGTVVVFQCNDGLFPNGVMDSTCTVIDGVGVWRPDTGITCRTIPVTCSLPPEATNGAILDYESFNQTVAEGTMLTYQCDSGLSLTGPMTIKCTNDGEWSDDPEGIMCVTISQTPDIGQIVGGVVGGLLFLIVLIVIIIIVLLVVSSKRAKYTVPAGPVYDEVSPAPNQQIELNTNSAYGPVTPGPVYEDVLSAPKQEIELKTNNAYGQVITKGSIT